MPITGFDLPVKVFLEMENRVFDYYNLGQISRTPKSARRKEKTKMRKRYPVILFIVLFPLTADVPVGAINIFPDSPTQAFGNGWIRSIAYSPDGELLVAAGSHGIWLYDAKTLQEVGHFGAELGAVYSIDISDDGRLLASGGGDGTVRLWEMAPIQQVAAFTGHDYRVTSLDFSRDGNFLASISPNATAYVWDVQIKRADC